MKTLLQVTSTICIAIGVLAIIGSGGNSSALTGGLMFAGQGALTLVYLNSLTYVYKGRK